MYLDMSKVLKPVEKHERDLRLYPRVRFDILYHSFDQNKRKFEPLFIRSEWKFIIKMFDEINKIVWNIASYRRNVKEWNKRRISVLHTMVFRLSLLVRDLHETLSSVINEEEIVWRNYILNMVVVLKQQKVASIGKDEAAEISPSPRISSLRLTIRQIFTPIENLLDSIESDLLAGNVDEDKLRQMETAMLIKILPWFYKVFRKTIEAGGGAGGGVGGSMGGRSVGGGVGGGAK